MSLNANTSNIVSSIYTSRRVLLEQMEYNGYDISEYTTFSINEISIMYNNKQMDMIMSSLGGDGGDGGTGKKIFVKYYLGKSMTTKILQDIIDEIFYLDETLKKTDTLCIVVKEEINDSMMAFLQHIWDTDGIYVVIRNLARLQFNILKHKLVPEHRLLGDAEIAEIKNKYNITNNNQFPRISRFDPVCVAIGLRPNEICVIKRPSKTSITSNYYKMCIN
jgi:DNA-directed RNA polymerase subunit H (RpoH/RPB5)